MFNAASNSKQRNRHDEENCLEAFAADDRHDIATII